MTGSLLARLFFLHVRPEDVSQVGTATGKVLDYPYVLFLFCERWTDESQGVDGRTAGETGIAGSSVE
jgi:hypothetical protein